MLVREGKVAILECWLKTEYKMIVAPTIPEIKFYLTLKINFTSNQSYCHSVFAVILLCLSRTVVVILKISSILLQKLMIF